MPSITDWLMVAITFIYAVITLCIFIANNNSAKISREELTEIKQQYNEMKRPIIEYEFCYEKRAWYIIRLVNHGRTTAQHIKVDLDDDFIESIPKEGFRDILRELRRKEFILGVEQHYDLYISGNELRGKHNLPVLAGKITYTGNGKMYESDIYIDLMKYPPFFSSAYSDDEKYLKELKDLNRRIRDIQVAINELAHDDRNDFGYGEHKYIKDNRVRQHIGISERYVKYRKRLN